CRVGASQQLGHSEVQHLYSTTHRDKNVCWFEIAMNNVPFMSRLERIANLSGEADQCVRCERSAARHAFKRLALNPFHYDERLILPFLDGKYCADVGVVQSGCQASLTPHTLKRPAVSTQRFRQEF